jgi:DNA mismatch repair ATPase MutS
MIKRFQNIKQKYSDTMILIKNGDFYRCYNEDTYILAYLLDYKVCSTDQSNMLGFPKDSLQKVLDTLEANKVSYKLVEIVNNELNLNR